jgi:hypothetical protein
MAKLKVNKKTVKIVLWVGVAAVAAYFLYQWYENRQQNAAGNTNTTNTGGGITSGLGTNLNSVNPIGSSSDNGNTAGPAYYGGAINVDVSQPITAAAPTPPVPGSPVTAPANPPTTGGNPDRHMHPKQNGKPWSTTNAVHRSPPRGKPNRSGGGRGGGNKSGAHK